MGQLCCFPFSRGEEKIGECGGSALPCASAGCAAAPGSLQLRKAGWRARGEKHAAEPDDAELVSLSKRLVENAVLKAVQQYLEETQNKTRQTDGSPVKTEEAASGTKNESDNDSSK